jgi:hypothetical protein
MKNILILLSFIININFSFLSAQTLVISQSEDYPLYTRLDEVY